MISRPFDRRPKQQQQKLLNALKREVKNGQKHGTLCEGGEARYSGKIELTHPRPLSPTEATSKSQFTAMAIDSMSVYCQLLSGPRGTEVVPQGKATWLKFRHVR